MRRGTARRRPLAGHGRRRPVEPLPDDGRRRCRARARGAPRAVGDRPRAPAGNQLLAELFGAQLHYVGCPPHHWGELEIAREQLTDELTARRRGPHSIPIGGSTATGALGYLAAYVELVEQCRALGMHPAAVVHTSSSGGTHAGLVAGRALLRALGHDDLPDVLAIGVAKGVDARRPGRAQHWPRRRSRWSARRRRRRRRRRGRHPLARDGLRRADAGRRRGDPVGGRARRVGARPHLHRQGLRRPARQRGHRPVAHRGPRSCSSTPVACPPCSPRTARRPARADAPTGDGVRSRPVRRRSPGRR